MASNNLASVWTVKIKSVPTSVNIFQLAQLIDLPRSRLCVPKDKHSGVPFVWISGFADEEEARKFAAQWSEDEEFVPSDMCSRNLFCNGRRCASCKKCRDWYYTGDWKGWKWIQDYNNGKVGDWQRFYRGKLAECFKRRDDAKCSRDSFYDHDDDNDGWCTFKHNVCFCEDNINIRL